MAGPALKSFICALSAFLALLIVISILLYALRQRDPLEENRTQLQKDSLRRLSTRTSIMKTTKYPIIKYKQITNLLTRTSLTTVSSVTTGITKIATIQPVITKSGTTLFTSILFQTKPMTTKPVTTELATIKPVTTEPVTTKPATTEAATIKPVTTKPSTTKSVTNEPPTTKPATTKLATTQSATTKPETTEPATTKPVTTKSTTKISTTESATTKPGTTEPASTKPITTESTTTLATTDSATTKPVKIVPVTAELTTTKPVTTKPTTTEPSTTETSTRIIATKPSTTPYKQTIYSQTTCQNGICKRAASFMLAMMNHDTKMSQCDDFYNVICQNPERYHEDIFFRSNFRAVTKTIQNSREDGIRFFADFYKSCTEFGRFMYRKDRIRFLNGVGASDLVQAMAESILTQSMPFFDVGINILDDKFIFEITLPGLSYLKTTVKSWSVLEQFKDSCIEQVAGIINQNVVELNLIAETIDLCIKESLESYINQTFIELDRLSQLPEMGHLADILKMVDQKKDLIETLLKVQDSLSLYRSDDNPVSKLKTTTVTEFQARYDLGMKWTDVFKKLTASAITDDSVIYFSEYLDDIFTNLIKKKANFQGMLDIWYNVQFYKNMVVANRIGNQGYYCMDLASQLIPEVASSILAGLNKNRNYEYYLVDDMMNDLKKRFILSLSEAGFTATSISVMQERIDQIKMAKPKRSFVGGDYFVLPESFPKKIMQLMKRYRKILYDFYSAPVTGEILLNYFVFAFDVQPKTFPPFREIVYQPGFIYEMSKNLPYYIRLAKQGLPLAKQISKHFIKNDFTNLGLNGTIIYEDFFKSFDAKYLLDRYKIENIDCEVEDKSGTYLKFESIVGDNMAFRLASDTFLQDAQRDVLPFLQDFSRKKTFIIIALQDFCKSNNLADFVGDFYNMKRLPAPMIVRNIVKNSQFFANTNKCSNPRFVMKQFPFVNKSIV